MLQVADLTLEGAAGRAFFREHVVESSESTIGGSGSATQGWGSKVGAVTVGAAMTTRAPLTFHDISGIFITSIGSMQRFDQDAWSSLAMR